MSTIMYRVNALWAFTRLAEVFEQHMKYAQSASPPFTALSDISSVTAARERDKIHLLSMRR